MVLLENVTALTQSIVPLFNENVNATTTSTAVTEVEQTLLDLIHQADSSIDVALYEFNRVSIQEALIAAHQRGVSVRIVTDDDVLASGDFSEMFEALELAGIPVVDDSRSSLMHNKFFIFDESIVWTGSMNMTNTGFTLNQNNSLVIASSELAEIYQIEFEEMFIDGRFGTAKLDNVDHHLLIADIPVEIYFSPTDLAMSQVISEVNEASESIYFSIFFLTNDDLRDALIAKMETGVAVYGVWDAVGAANFYSDDEALCEAGAQITIENFAGKVHHKFMVIDPQENDATLITGSMNWSRAGDESNDENTLIIHDVDLAEAYLTEYQTQFNALPLHLMCNPNVIYVPTIMTP